MNSIFSLLLRIAGLYAFMSSQSVRPVQALPQYTSLIPNGNSVPNPIDGGVWIGVGHINVAGGGPNDQFGIDFKQAGFIWTEALCQQDSDGDGLTNGQELGDPDCIWYEGGPDPVGPAVSHPGIAEGSISVTTGGTSQGGYGSSEDGSDSEDEDDDEEEEFDQSADSTSGTSFAAYLDESAAASANKNSLFTYTLLAFIFLTMPPAILN